MEQQEIGVIQNPLTHLIGTENGQTNLARDKFWNRSDKEIRILDKGSIKHSKEQQCLIRHLKEKEGEFIKILKVLNRRSC